MSTSSKPSGPPLRAIAMVLISLTILFAGLGFASLGGGGGDESSATTTTQATTTQATTPAAPPAAATPTTTEAAPEHPPVTVLNNSGVSGLAADTAATLTTAGYPVVETGNYADTTFPATTVLYDPAVAGEQEAATAIAGTLGATAQARTAETQSIGAGIVVLVTAG